VVWEVPPAAALRGRVDYDGATELQAAMTAPVEHGARTLVLPPPAPDPNKPVANPALFGALDLSAEPALRAFLDAPPPSWCGAATLGKKDKFRWTRRLTSEDVTERCKELDVGDVLGLQVDARGKSGRVRTLKIVGTKGIAYVHR